MTLRLIQPGAGDRRHLVLAYFVANAKAFATLPSEVCVLADVDNPGGRFVQPPGKGGVDGVDAALAFARQHAGLFAVASLALVGWSAGCEAVREQLRVGATPDAVIGLDGISGSLPPLEAQLDPWRPVIARSRAGEALFILTHTAMGYTEHLPPGQRYASTTHVAQILTGTAGAAPPGEGDVAAVDGSLYVLGYPSGDIDAGAHERQQTEVLPDLIQRILVPWWTDRDASVPVVATSG